MLLSYRDVREAAKDWKTFSSDAPFRVPIPSEENVRTVRQLRIEIDPPHHKTYRDLLEPIFRRPKRPDYLARIQALVTKMVKALPQTSQRDAVRDFALPLQSRALAYLLDLPKHYAAEWIGWGTHVFRDGDEPETKGSHLDTYLRAEITKARQDKSASGFFAELVTMQVYDRPLTEDEALGMANLVFAGGRDTVINSIVFILAYFAARPDDIRKAAQTPRTVNLAVEEFIRVISPLTYIGRVCPAHTDLGSVDVERDARISLGWAAANYDPSIFDQAESICLDRVPNPHVGFGSGIHSCLGAHQARAILRSLITALADSLLSIEILDAEPNLETFGTLTRQVGFKHLVISAVKK